MVVERSNSTGSVDDLAAALGAFGLPLHVFHVPVTTGLVDIRIDARAAVQTEIEAEVISKPVRAKI